MAATAHREIRVDRTLCMGSGQCSWYAPNTFDQDDETIAIVIDPRATRPRRSRPPSSPARLGRSRSSPTPTTLGIKLKKSKRNGGGWLPPRSYHSAQPQSTERSRSPAVLAPSASQRPHPRQDRPDPVTVPGASRPSLFIPDCLFIAGDHVSARNVPIWATVCYEKTRSYEQLAAATEARPLREDQRPLRQVRLDPAEPDHRPERTIRVHGRPAATRPHPQAARGDRGRRRPPAVSPARPRARGGPRGSRGVN